MDRLMDVRNDRVTGGVHCNHGMREFATSMVMRGDFSARYFIGAEPCHAEVQVKIVARSYVNTSRIVIWLPAEFGSRIVGAKDVVPK